ncbi:unnamed protein product, partial [Mesorhabditis spiculigera]
MSIDATQILGRLASEFQLAVELRPLTDEEEPIYRRLKDILNGVTTEDTKQNENTGQCELPHPEAKKAAVEQNGSTSAPVEPTCSTEPPEEDFSHLPEPTEENIIAAITELVQVKKINFVDWNVIDDIYPELDEVSVMFGGLPDSLLKPCFLKFLELQLHDEKPGWMRQHLEDLIRIWKREVISPILFERPTRVQLVAKVIVPQPPENKRKRKAAGADVRGLFGVGALLQTISTGVGVVDVDEDVHGNIMLGGEPLTFDSWGKLNQYENLPKPEPPTPRGRPKLPTKEELEKIRREKLIAKKARNKARKADKIAKMREGLGTDAEANEAEPAKDLEEGEVDSGEEDKQKSKKRIKMAKNSSSSSSSSGSDSEAEGQGSRHRRRERRMKERMGQRPNTVKMPKMLQDMYERRMELVALLSPEHRSAFASVLNMVLSSDNRMSSQTISNMFSQMDSLIR